MIVVDTSAVLAALVGRPADPALHGRIADDGDLHAPHLVDVELLHALRRLTRTGALTVDRADEARGDYALLTIRRYPHVLLGERIWQLRDTLTAYDATFVALAELLGVPLVTCDARLARAPGHDAAVEVFAGGDY